MLRVMLFLTALILPVSVAAVPATMEVLNGSEDGFSFSYVHDATGCEDSGFFMCGTKIGTPITGILSADLTNDIFSGINGSLTVGALGTYDVTGQLDFNAAESTPIGFLNFAPTGGGPILGIFSFINLPIFPGPPNSYVDDQLFLWGQTFGIGTNCPGEVGFPECGSDGQLGIDLSFKVPRRDTPEPALLGLLAGAGGLLLMGRRRA